MNSPYWVPGDQVTRLKTKLLLIADVSTIYVVDYVTYDPGVSTK